MKRFSILATLLLTFFVLGGTAAAQQAPGGGDSPKAEAKPDDKTANIDGKWTFTVDAGGQVIDLAVEIKQTKEDFTGTMASMVGSGQFDKGKITGNKMKATLNAEVQGNPTAIEVEGKVEGEKITGTLNVPNMGVIPFTATRVK